MSTHSIYSEAVDELVAVGAAIASNCEPCLEYHVSAARALGVSNDDLLRAVKTGRKVKAAPARNVAKLAERLLADGGTLDEPEAPSDDSPCCRGKGEAKEEAVEARCAAD